MALDFPNSPLTGQLFTQGQTTWIYDGVKWVSAGTTSAIFGEIGWACSDQLNNLTPGLKLSDRWVGNKKLLGVRLHCTVAPTGSPLIVSIKYGTAALFTTRPQIDAGQLTSFGSTVVPVFATTNLPDGTDIHFTIDQVGATVKGQGLIVYLLWSRN